MMKKPTHVADHWAIIAKADSFCCDDHRQEAEAIFFAGAMAALHAITGWDPETDGGLPVAVDSRQLADVTDELTARWYNTEAEERGQAVRN